MQATAYPHVILDDEGVLRTGDSWYKVRILVEEYLGGRTPQDMVEAHPLLTMAEAHAALAYYWDHKDEIDAEIARLEAFAQEYFRTTPEPPIVARLREHLKNSGD